MDLFRHPLSFIFSFSPDAVPQLAGVLATLAVHFWRRNLMLSIAVGTACYMVMVRI